MAHSNTVLSQLLKLIPRHEIERLANTCDGKRRSDALSRWSQLVALFTGHLGNRRSLRDRSHVSKPVSASLSYGQPGNQSFSPGTGQ